MAIIGAVVGGAFEKSPVFAEPGESKIVVIDPEKVNDFQNDSRYISIDENDVLSMELLSQGKKDPSLFLDVAATAFFGMFAGALTHMAQQGDTIYRIQLGLTNNRNMVVDCNRDGYDVIQRMYINSLNVSNKNETIPESAIHINPNTVEPTVQRIELFLENNEWTKVQQYAEAALDYFPDDYRLYQYLVFANNKVKNYEELKKNTDSLSKDINIKMLRRFGNEDVKKELDEIDNIIQQNKEKEELYLKAIKYMNDNAYDEAEAIFATLNDYKESKLHLFECNCGKKYLEEEKKQQKERAGNLYEVLDERNALVEKLYPKYEKLKQFQLEKTQSDNKLLEIDNSIMKLKGDLLSLGLFGNGEKKKELKAEIEKLRQDKKQIEQDDKSRLAEEQALVSELDDANEIIAEKELPLLKPAGFVKRYVYNYDNRDRIGKKITSFELPVPYAVDSSVFEPRSYIVIKREHNLLLLIAYDGRVNYNYLPSLVRYSLVSHNQSLNANDDSANQVFIPDEETILDALPDAESRIILDGLCLSDNCEEEGKKKIVDYNGNIQEIIENDNEKQYSEKDVFWVDVTKIIEAVEKNLPNNMYDCNNNEVLLNPDWRKEYSAQKQKEMNDPGFGALGTVLAVGAGAAIAATALTDDND